MDWTFNEQLWFTYAKPHIKIYVFYSNGEWRMNCNEAGFCNYILLADDQDEALSKAIEAARAKLLKMLEEIT
jgi:hypothetical protein